MKFDSKTKKMSGMLWSVGVCAIGSASATANRYKWTATGSVAPQPTRNGQGELVSAGDLTTAINSASDSTKLSKVAPAPMSVCEGDVGAGEACSGAAKGEPLADVRKTDCMKMLVTTHNKYTSWYVEAKYSWIKGYQYQVYPKVEAGYVNKGIFDKPFGFQEIVKKKDQIEEAFSSSKPAFANSELSTTISHLLVTTRNPFRGLATSRVDGIAQIFQLLKEDQAKQLFDVLKTPTKDIDDSVVENYVSTEKPEKFFTSAPAVVALYDVANKAFSGTLLNNPDIDMMAILHTYTPLLSAEDLSAASRCQSEALNVLMDIIVLQAFSDDSSPDFYFDQINIMSEQYSSSAEITTALAAAVTRNKYALWRIVLLPGRQSSAYERLYYFTSGKYVAPSMLIKAGIPEDLRGDIHRWIRKAYEGHHAEENCVSRLCQSAARCVRSTKPIDFFFRGDYFFNAGNDFTLEAIRTLDEDGFTSSLCRRAEKLWQYLRTKDESLKDYIESPSFGFTLLIRGVSISKKSQQFINQSILGNRSLRHVLTELQGKFAGGKKLASGLSVEEFQFELLVRCNIASIVDPDFYLQHTDLVDAAAAVAGDKLVPEVRSKKHGLWQGVCLMSEEDLTTFVDPLDNGSLTRALMMLIFAGHPDTGMPKQIVDLVQSKIPAMVEPDFYVQHIDVVNAAAVVVGDELAQAVTANKDRLWNKVRFMTVMFEAEKCIADAFNGDASADKLSDAFRKVAEIAAITSGDQTSAATNSCDQAIAAMNQTVVSVFKRIVSKVAEKTNLPKKDQPALALPKLENIAGQVDDADFALLASKYAARFQQFVQADGVSAPSIEIQKVQAIIAAAKQLGITAADQQDWLTNFVGQPVKGARSEAFMMLVCAGIPDTEMRERIYNIVLPKNPDSPILSANHEEATNPETYPPPKSRFLGADGLSEAQQKLRTDAVDQIGRDLGDRFTGLFGEDEKVHKQTIMRRAQAVALAYTQKAAQDFGQGSERVLTFLFREFAHLDHATFHDPTTLAETQKVSDFYFSFMDSVGLDMSDPNNFDAGKKFGALTKLVQLPTEVQDLIDHELKKDETFADVLNFFTNLSQPIFTIPANGGDVARAWADRLFCGGVVELAPLLESILDINYTRMVQKGENKDGNGNPIQLDALLKILFTTGPDNSNMKYHVDAKELFTKANTIRQRLRASGELQEAAAKMAGPSHGDTK